MAKRRAANIRGELAQGIAAMIVMERRRNARHRWALWAGVVLAAALGIAL